MRFRNGVMKTKDDQMQNAILLDPSDNVLVAPYQLNIGDEIEGVDGKITAIVPAGHKIARRQIIEGEATFKHATHIGVASCEISAGEWIHTHNISAEHEEKNFRFASNYRKPNYSPRSGRPTFLGFSRPNGQVGTRNYIGIFITVNCAATVARKIAAHFTDAVMDKYQNVDGVIPFVHQQGCGMEQTGEPIDLLRRTLAGYVSHANISGALVVGLGCERNNLEQFFLNTGLEQGKNIRALRMQSLGGTCETIEQGISSIHEMLESANRFERSRQSIEHLKIGLQCGGSDGFSGISANPALGRAMDRLIEHGGTAILSETPELYGMEDALCARARNEEVARALLERINWWLEYTDGRDVQMQGTVGPGNQEGGLANVIEKALGGAKKAGSTGLEAVYKYAETITSSGFVIMDTPGFDPVSATGQIAGGANLICFTTGRGSCFGSYPSPTIKLASNSDLYEKMNGDMDINCGPVIDGIKTLDEVGDEILECIIDVASGRLSKSEELGVGADEFAPWAIGVTG